MVSRMLPLTGAILAGGQSRRMGRPKASLPLPDGRPMIEHVLEPLLALCSRVAIVGHSPGWAVPMSDRLLHLPDHEPGLGPLGGLATLLGSGLNDAYLIAACDQPLITVDLLQRLAAGDPRRAHLFRGPDPDSFHPFPGFYPANLLGTIRDLLREGHPSLRALTARHETVWVELSAAEEQRLAGVNTPEQFLDIQRIYELK